MITTIRIGLSGGGVRGTMTTTRIVGTIDHDAMRMMRSLDGGMRAMNVRVGETSDRTGTTATTTDRVDGEIRMTSAMMIGLVGATGMMTGPAAIGTDTMTEC